MIKTLSFLACVWLLAGATPARSDQAVPTDLSVRKTTTSATLQTSSGFTLYTLARNVFTGGADCEGDCAKVFPPAIVSPNSKPVTGFSIITRSDGAKQWAFEGEALYSYSQDNKTGDENGTAYIPIRTAIANDPVRQLWHVATLPSSLAPGIALGSSEIGSVLTDNRGMTLYASDRDKLGKVACDRECGKQWRPLTAPAVAISGGDWNVTSRDDGLNQWSFQGKPLYTSVRDVKAGEASADGDGGIWHAVVVRPAPTPPPGVTIQRSAIGPVFADAQGHTLYAWFNTEARLKTVCNDDCMKKYWKPLAPPPAFPTNSGWNAISRHDGTQQLTYGGTPVFVFVQDNFAGDIHGYNFGYPPQQDSGAWQPVRPWF